MPCQGRPCRNKAGTFVLTSVRLPHAGVKALESLRWITGAYSVKVNYAGTAGGTKKL